MHKRDALILSAAAAISLSSCVVPVEGGLNYEPGAFAPGNSFSGNSQTAYTQGYEMGRNDAREGKSSDHTRYSSQYDYVTMDAFSNGYRTAYRNYKPHNSGQSGSGNRGNYKATTGQGQVTITDGGRTVSTVRTAAPNVENFHFTNKKKQIVVKSRGNHGPATVELFDVQTGTLRDKVLAFAIENGQPDWARGMQD